MQRSILSPSAHAKNSTVRFGRARAKRFELASASSRSRALLELARLSRGGIKGKVVSERRRNQHARRERYPRRKLARAYSRFNLAMKLAVISAGQTASHS